MREDGNWSSPQICSFFGIDRAESLGAFLRSLRADGFAFSISFNRGRKSSVSPALIIQSLIPRIHDEHQKQ